MNVRDYVLKNDFELVKLFQDGDVRAFTALNKKHHKFLIGICNILTKKNEKASEALLHESYITALSDFKQRQYKVHSSFTAWMNSVIEKTFQLSPLSEKRPLDFSYEEDLIADESTPESNLMKEEFNLLLKKLIAPLDSKLKKIIIMFFIEKYSYEEIAEDMDMDINEMIDLIKANYELLPVALLKAC
jgi:RNA polymerase sigma factor (sigma-70 family)